MVMSVALLVGLPGMVTGLQLAHHTENHIRLTGFIGIGGGALFMLLGLPLTLAVVRKLKALPLREMHYFLLTVLKSLPSR